MSLSLAALSRSNRVLIVAVLILMSTVVPRPHPARADESDCEVVTGTQLIECGVDVREVGIDAEWWRPMVALYFEPEDVERAMCLMGRESGGDPEARNPSTNAAGLMQVMPFWADKFGYRYNELFDPGINVWVARQILDQQGWRAWSPYVRGSCR